jgi:hypothetical protein
MGSQGNGLISRRIIYYVLEQLKTTNPKDILVGIMWSGPNRHDFYLEEGVSFDIESQWMENPTGFVKDSKPSWVILNHNWNDKNSRNYYNNYHSIIGSLIYTVENILRVQWFLKLHNVPYFMSTYTAQVLPKIAQTHPDIEYLYHQIDKSTFLPVAGEYEWCLTHMPDKFPRPGDHHPGIEQHTAFTEQVIVPFLKERNYI